MRTIPQSLTRSQHFVLVVLVLSAFVGRSSMLRAASDTPGTELLRKAAVFIGSQKSFNVVIEVERRTESLAFDRRSNSTILLSVARPNRVAMREQGGPNGMTVVADGKQFSRGIAAQIKKYQVGDALPSLDEVFHDPVANMMCTAIGTPFFRTFFSGDWYEELMYDVTASREMGLEEIDGHACGHLQLEQSETIWDLWIDTGDTPFVRKVSVQPKELLTDSELDKTRLRVSVAYRFHDWNVAPKFAADEFEFRPEADWEKVDSLIGQGPSRDWENRPGSLTSLGDPAPDVTITPFKGSPVQLADLRGRVVLLNFFATWCGPCKMELPDLQKIWNEFHDNDDFQLFVIDCEESAEIVEAFKDKGGFTFPVALDLDGSVFDRFATMSVPRTYLIDRDGKIIYQCTGYDFEKKERKKLRALLKKELGM